MAEDWNNRSWKIKSRDGRDRCSVKKLEYNGIWMEESSVTVTVTSSVPINFEIGDSIVYRGESFVLDYIPTSIKKARSGSTGDAFTYESVKFRWLASELKRCMFLDCVKYGNKIHYFPLPNYSFYADSISKFIERIQANLDRFYESGKSGGKWNILLDRDGLVDRELTAKVKTTTVWGALSMLNSLYGVTFTIKGRTIRIGGKGYVADNIFKYGKGNGLYEIQKNTDSSQKIITRLRAYGSTRNMPFRYYYNKSGSDIRNFIPNDMANTNLMLPGFPEDVYDVYIDSPNIDSLGLREDSVFFDGTNGLEEIYPTIENMRADDLTAAGISVSVDDGDNGFLDQIAGAEQITDDGVPPEEPKEDKEHKDGKKEPSDPALPEKPSTFTITLKDIGFDIKDNLSREKATIAMKSGMCGGREFEITECKKEGNKYVLTCNRVLDNGIQRYFPYSDYNIKAGDKFVLLNIQMPDVYIKAASQRLLKAAKEYLAKIDHIRYTYTPKVDEIYMARQHESGGSSIYMSIKEGDILRFEDSDLGIRGNNAVIDHLTIREGVSLIPLFEVVLREEKEKGVIDSINDRIESLEHGVRSLPENKGLDASQFVEGLKTYGSRMFLSKLGPDTAHGLITFLKGLISDTIKSKGFKPNSEGFVLKTDENGKSYLEVDNALFRRKATFIQLVTALLRHVGGQIILSPASMKCIRVEERDNAYRCYFRNTDGERCVYNEFVVEDLARAQKFGSVKVGVHKNISTHYFWRAVVGVGDDYIDLSKTDCDNGSDAPKVGDDICQFGNKSDTDRQSVILLSAYGEYAGIYQFGGVNDYSLKGKEQTAISPSGNRFTGDFIVKGKNITEIIDKSKTDAINQSNGYTEGIKAELDHKVEATKESMTIQYNKTTEKLGGLDARLSQAELKITPDAITSVVKSNLKVGGRNLLFNFYAWDYNGFERTIKENGVRAILKKQNSSLDKATGSNVFDRVGEHTFSLYVKNPSKTQSVKLYFGLRGRITSYSHRQYSQNGMVYVLPPLFDERLVWNIAYDKMVSGNVYVGVAADSEGQMVELYKPKLEKGNIPTDWSAAPEDTEASITELSTRIEQTDRSIGLRVNQGIANSGAVGANLLGVTDLEVGHFRENIFQFNGAGHYVFSGECVPEYYTEEVKIYTTDTYGNNIEYIDAIKFSTERFYKHLVISEERKYGYLSVSRDSSPYKVKLKRVMLTKGDIEWPYSPYTTKEQILSSIDMTEGGISFFGKELKFKGIATFEAIDNAKKEITGKLGKLAYSDSVRTAMEKETIIAGGFIKTSLINVDELEAKRIKSATGTFSMIESGQENNGNYMRLTNDLIYFNGVNEDGAKLMRFGHNALVTTEINGKYSDTLEQMHDRRTISPFVIKVSPRSNAEYVGLGINMSSNGEVAIKVAKGVYKGFRRPVRSVASPNEFDTHIIADTNGTISLPTMEAGQELCIWVPKGYRPTIGRIRADENTLYFALRQDDYSWTVAKIGSIMY